jgi:hypothetical protein
MADAAALADLAGAWTNLVDHVDADEARRKR